MCWNSSSLGASTPDRPHHPAAAAMGRSGGINQATLEMGIARDAHFFSSVTG